MEAARTERLLLRRFEERDAPAFFALHADPEVLRYTGDSPFASVEESLALIRGYDCYVKDGFGRWTVERRSDGVVLGWCGLRMQPEGLVDLGYRLHRRFWGQGYATEAALASLAFGFGQAGLDLIIARTDPANTRSKQVLDRIGMNYWKTDSCDHSWVADHYRIQREEWLRR